MILFIRTSKSSTDYWNILRNVYDLHINAFKPSIHTYTSILCTLITVYIIHFLALYPLISKFHIKPALHSAHHIYYGILSNLAMLFAIFVYMWISVMQANCSLLHLLTNMSSWNSVAFTVLNLHIVIHLKLIDF